MLTGCSKTKPWKHPAIARSIAVAELLPAWYFHMVLQVVQNEGLGQRPSIIITQPPHPLPGNGACVRMNAMCQNLLMPPAAQGAGHLKVAFRFEAGGWSRRL